MNKIFSTRCALIVPYERQKYILEELIFCRQNSQDAGTYHPISIAFNRPLSALFFKILNIFLTALQSVLSFIQTFNFDTVYEASCVFSGLFLTIAFTYLIILANQQLLLTLIKSLLGPFASLFKFFNILTHVPCP